MNKQLEIFFDNTKQLHLLLSISLLLIMIIMVSPINLGFGKPVGQGVIVAILVYILFKNFTETHNFSILQKKLKKKQLKKEKSKNNRNEEEDMIDEQSFTDMKNNTIASYILCGFIFILLLYVIYSIFF
jgi:hypothetical protein